MSQGLQNATVTANLAPEQFESPHRLFQLLAPLAAMLATFHAAATETMVWVMPDFPPASIPDKGQPGNGVADRVVQYIVSKWPEAAHRFIYANAKRTWQMLEQGDKVCYAAALRTKQREQVAYFTNTNILAPPSLIVRQLRPKDFPDDRGGPRRLHH